MTRNEKTDLEQGMDKETAPRIDRRHQIGVRTDSYTPARHAPVRPRKRGQYARASKCDITRHEAPLVSALAVLLRAESHVHPHPLTLHRAHMKGDRVLRRRSDGASTKRPGGEDFPRIELKPPATGDQPATPTGGRTGGHRPGYDVPLTCTSISKRLPLACDPKA